MNSQLLFHENGRIAPDDFRAENISVFFDLPAKIESAELFIAAHKDAPDASPLRVHCWGKQYSCDASDIGPTWLRAKIDIDDLREGENTITIAAQDGWRVAHENTTPVIRFRVAGAGENAEIFPRYGDAEIKSNAKAWLELLPEHLQELSSRWDWCWNLAGWLASAWPYANETDDAISYAPWDARVILEWGRAQKDDRGEKPIAMCVHYGICFVQFCIAIGVPARAVVLSPDLYSPNGHFVAEVWLDEFQSWAMIDPNLHLCFPCGSTQRPLAIAELYARREELKSLAEFGEGFETQKTRLESFARDWCLSGEVYRLWGVWARHDWIENRQFAPPAHGATIYAETDIIWREDETTNNELAMFPHFLAEKKLAQPPT